jgi:hypothetical protein
MRKTTGRERMIPRRYSNIIPSCTVVANNACSMSTLYFTNATTDATRLPTEKKTATSVAIPEKVSKPEKARKVTDALSKVEAWDKAKGRERIEKDENENGSSQKHRTKGGTGGVARDQSDKLTTRHVQAPTSNTGPAAMFLNLDIPGTNLPSRSIPPTLRSLSM